MKKIKKRDLIFIVAVILSIIIGGVLIDNSLDEVDDNQLGYLRYNITAIQDDSFCGASFDENNDIIRKTYAINKNFLRINVEVAPYDTYETAVVADDKFEFLEYHIYGENHNPGIEKIVCGIVKSDREYRGAMAWIYTDCGAYTILVKSLTRNYNKCEEMLHTVLSGISLAKKGQDDEQK